jgi:hypothetical protein
MAPSTPSFRAWGVKTAQISWRNDATWLEKVASTAARQLVATTDVKMKYRKWWLNYNPSIDGVIFCSVAEIPGLRSSNAAKLIHCACHVSAVGE